MKSNFSLHKLAFVKTNKTKSLSARAVSSWITSLNSSMALTWIWFADLRFLSQLQNDIDQRRTIRSPIGAAEAPPNWRLSGSRRSAVVIIRISVTEWIEGGHSLKIPNDVSQSEKPTEPQGGCRRLQEKIPMAKAPRRRFGSSRMAHKRWPNTKNVGEHMKTWPMMNIELTNMPWLVTWNFSRERLRRVLRKKAAVIIHLHTLTPADLHLHTFTSADLHLHTFTSADLHLHTFTSLIYIFTPSHLLIYIFTHLLIYIFTPSHLQIYIFTPSHLQIYIFTPSHLQIYTFTPSHLQIYVFTPSHLQISSPSSFNLSLKAGVVPPERHETQPFRKKWTLDVKIEVKS